MSFLDLGQPPLDLLRARKTVKVNKEGVCLIQKDLYCCGHLYKDASSVNAHYVQKHADLPHSDPKTWCMIEIRDEALHAAANVSIPYIPFPASQPRKSTWTTQVSARVPGTREERFERRLKLRSRDIDMEREYEQLQLAYNDLEEMYQSKIEENEKLRASRARGKENIARLKEWGQNLKRLRNEQKTMRRQMKVELDAMTNDCARYKEMYDEAIWKAAHRPLDSYEQENKSLMMRLQKQNTILEKSNSYLENQLEKLIMRCRMAGLQHETYESMS